MPFGKKCAIKSVTYICLEAHFEAHSRPCERIFSCSSTYESLCRIRCNCCSHFLTNAPWNPLIQRASMIRFIHHNPLSRRVPPRSPHLSQRLRYCLFPLLQMSLVMSGQEKASIVRFVIDLLLSLSTPGSVLSCISVRAYIDPYATSASSSFLSVSVKLHLPLRTLPLLRLAAFLNSLCAFPLRITHASHQPKHEAMMVPELSQNHQ